MAVSRKAFAIREELAADLAIRLPSFGQAKSFDTNGDAVLSLGPLGVPTTTDVTSAVIRVKALPSPAPGVDILGLTQDVWTPHVIQMSYEVSAAQADASYMTTASWTLLMGEMMKFGVRIELWERTNGTAPAVANLDSPHTNTTLKAVFDPHVQFPLAGQ